jgi:hypothetical protein
MKNIILTIATFISFIIAFLLFGTYKDKDKNNENKDNQ